ncbi:ABC transporter permease [Anoxybacter fermentans]|uniref:ABC transporter permease n=1 Tax=Anoxybacter fermentans TaxID=1323375 RepID=A0A3S9SYZ0_9FIRM|nr:ABC transporter permease [Anoxybacter fermentans]AZR73392.1 ABC transporter permease [Anoxybacter fermentans]
MLEYISKRIGQIILVLFVITILVFLMMQAVGDPIANLLPPDAEPWEVEEMKVALGLDKPLYIQYILFLKNALHGNLGVSFYHQVPALKLVIERLPATLELAIIAIIISIVISIPAGIYTAVKPDSFLTRIIMSGSLLGISLPTFLIGILFILVFSVNLSWLPSSGRGEVIHVMSFDISLLTLDGWKHILMPAATLGFYMVAMLIRLVKAGMEETLQQDYIKFARAKGVPERIITLKHALRNTMVPVVTVIGLQLGRLIAFSMITEKIFAWPGIGKLILDSIHRVDRPVVMAYLLIIAIIFAFINLIVDVLYLVIDPRIKLS